MVIRFGLEGGIGNVLIPAFEAMSTVARLPKVVTLLLARSGVIDHTDLGIGGEDLCVVGMRIATILAIVALTGPGVKLAGFFDLRHLARGPRRKSQKK